jgi:hypothetical protein
VVHDGSVSLDTHFYVQRLVDGRWAVPRGFAHCDGARCTCRHTGLFASFSNRPRLLDLFQPAETRPRPPWALFDARLDPPPGIQDSGLFHPAAPARVESMLEEWWRFWLPWPELLTDSWPRQQLLISGSVPSRFAPLFGDGTGPLPRGDLLAAGMAPEALTDLEDAQALTASPARPTPGQWARVTWSVTLDEFVGPQAERFHAAASCGPAEQLRLICMRH